MAYEYGNSKICDVVHFLLWENHMNVFMKKKPPRADGDNREIPTVTTARAAALTFARDCVFSGSRGVALRALFPSRTSCALFLSAASPPPSQRIIFSPF